LALVVATVACIALPMGIAAQETDGVALTVSVVDQVSGLVSGAIIVATWDDGNETVVGTTASNGRVFIDVPRGADVELDIRNDDRSVRNQPRLARDADERVESNPTTVTGIDPDADSASPTETVDGNTP
jgi:hypothetical protein